MNKNKPEGWAWIDGANKLHYIGPDGRSLCGRWLYLGTVYETGECEKWGRCAECVRRRAKQLAKAGVANA